MTDPVQAISGERAEDEPRNRLVRIGTWFLIPPRSVQDNAVVVHSLVEALGDDTRVVNVVPPVLNDYWTYRRDFYPDLNRTSRDGVRTGVDGFQALEMSDFICFRVRVPIKNQEPHQDIDDVPSDTYFVIWNGIVILVMWEQDADSVPMSGGHVVEKVLKEVLGKIGCQLYVQSCSPDCDFLFLHRTLRIEEDSQVEDFEMRGCSDPRLLTYVAKSRRDDPEEELEQLGLVCREGVSDFADFKNSSRRLIDLEVEVRKDVERLLSHYQAHAALVAAGWGPRCLWQRWANRSWRREAWALVAGIWLAIANIEILLREWADERGAVNERERLVDLLVKDVARDVDVVGSLNLAPVTETVSQVTTVLNSQSAAKAALFGALAGGIAGGGMGILGGS